MKLPGWEPSDMPSLRRQSFSLIEVVGVLAIIAILAALAVPSLIKRVDEAASTKETVDLSALANALPSAILRNKAIPDESNWVQVVANELAVPLNKVSATPNGNPRVFLIDPALRLGTINGVLPYAQGTNGSVNPGANARLMILSSRSIPLPLSSDTNSNFSSKFGTPWTEPSRRPCPVGLAAVEICEFNGSTWGRCSTS